MSESSDADQIPLDFYKKRLESTLFNILQEQDIPASRLKEAMQYMLLPPGKCVRPMLVYLSGELLGLNLDCLDIIAASIELTHCYSLIHDDLPAMDNDDFRRNKPSCHKAFDEATAILVGDALQPLSMEILLSKLNPFLNPSQIIAITLELVKSAGVSGMVSGQSLDLSDLCKKQVSEERLKHIHSLKTGKLILACINMVLIAAEAGESKREALRSYARHLGLVFQMQDDYLDAYAPRNFLGKQRASDVENNKTTFASLYPEPALLELIHHHYGLAKDALKIFDEEARCLIHLTNTIEARSP